MASVCWRLKIAFPASTVLALSVCTHRGEAEHMPLKKEEIQLFDSKASSYISKGAVAELLWVKKSLQRSLHIGVTIDTQLTSR